MRTRLGRLAVPILAAVGLLTFALVPATASAQTYPTPPAPSSTDPCRAIPAPAFCHTGQVKTAAATSSSGLAFTGANIALFVVVGLAILIAGFVLVRLSRRPQTTS